MENYCFCPSLAKQIFGSRGNYKEITPFVMYLGGLMLLLQWSDRPLNWKPRCNWWPWHYRRDWRNFDCLKKIRARSCTCTFVDVWWYRTGIQKKKIVPLIGEATTWSGHVAAYHKTIHQEWLNYNKWLLAVLPYFERPWLHSPYGEPFWTFCTPRKQRSSHTEHRATLARPERVGEKDWNKDRIPVSVSGMILVRQGISRQPPPPLLCPRGDSLSSTRWQTEAALTNWLSGRG